MRLVQLLSGAFVSLAMLASAAAGPHGVAWVGTRRAPDAVVWVDAPGAPPLQGPRKVVLDQRDLRFWPHVLAVRVGTVVEFPNSDRVFHNVFSFRDGKRFDLGFYPVGAVKTQVFDRPGLSRIFCNIHPNMAAYVLAVDSAYFAVSDDNGAFSIPLLPPGQHGYHAWRPGGTLLAGTASFGNETPVEIRWP